MSLTVLSIAYPFAPVGPHGVGGAEKILGDLDQALVDAGHRSIVVACEGSQTAGKLLSVRVPDHDVFDETRQDACRKQFQQTIDRALASESVDLVHMHGMDFHCYTLPAHLPVLATLHLPIAWYPPEIWNRLNGKVQFCCVSESQRRSCPPQLETAMVVENGVALPPFDPNAPREDFALVLGRICPEKNAHAALEAGSLSGTPVLLGGHVFPYRDHIDYYREKIEPLVNASREPARHQFLGTIDLLRRQHLLSRAKCLLHPTLAPETSSLVAMEALASGTPVVAFPSGALSEIVEHGVTGFLVRSAEGMAKAIASVPTISPRVCRSHAERRFSKERMIQRYFEIYESMSCRKQMETTYV